MAIIEVRNVTKEFRLGAMAGLKETVIGGVKRLAGRPVPRPNAFKALDDVSFSIEPGEVVGLVGHNGAGKSTMLKILSNIVTPTSGQVRIGGKVSPLIEVGAGLIAEMTGRENIYVSASILGMKRAQIDRKLDEIVAFAELERFIDTPVKRFSSGMHARLGFAIATAIDAPILIVDEVLAVGDLSFQRKCYDRIEELVRRGERTILLVSHNLRQVERLCSRALMLNAGKLVKDGDPVDVCNAIYEQSNKKIAAVRASVGGRYESSPDFRLDGIRLLAGGAEASELPLGSDVEVEVRFTLMRAQDELNFTLGVHTTDLFFIGVSGSDKQLQVPRMEAGSHAIRCTLRRLPLVAGVYAVHFGVETGLSNSPLFRGDNLASFEVSADARERSLSERRGVIALDAAWSKPEPGTAPAPAPDVAAGVPR